MGYAKDSIEYSVYKTLEQHGSAWDAFVSLNFFASFTFWVILTFAAFTCILMIFSEKTRLSYTAHIGKKELTSQMRGSLITTFLFMFYVVNTVAYFTMTSTAGVILYHYAKPLWLALDNYYLVASFRIIAYFAS